MIRATGVFLCGVLAFTAGGAVLADSPTVRAYVVPEGQVSDTQPIQLVVRIEGSDRPSVTPPRLPGLDNLRVINGPRTSHNFSWINGQSSTVVTLTWTLMAEDSGTASIPALEIVVDGKTYPTAAIRLDVIRGATAPPATPAPGSPAPLPGREQDEADVFLRARLSGNAVYVGQPVTLELTLLSSVGVSDLDFPQAPSLSGFWVEDVEVDPEAERTVETVGGRRYYAWPLARKILIPTRRGTFNIEPYTARVRLSRTSSDPFGFFRSGAVVYRKTDPLELEVQGLPVAGRPEDFSGAVGTFTLEAEVDREEAGVDDAVALRVTVSGTGSLKAAGTPHLESTPQLTVFEPRIRERTDTTAGRMRSRKSWEWIVVPLSAGEVLVPPIRFSYFDPGSGSYRELVRDDILLAVRGGGGEARASGGGMLRPQRRDIRFIKPPGRALRADGDRLHRRSWFRALAWLPVVLIPAWIAIGRRRARLDQDRGLARSRKAKARARKSLASTARHSEQLDTGTFHEEVSRALVQYVADRFDRSASGMTYDLADRLLASRGVDEDLRGQFRRCLETCDFARFVPASGGQERRNETLDEARRLIAALEKAT